MACAILYDVVFLLMQISCCWRTSQLLARRAAVGDHHKDDFAAGDHDDEHIKEELPFCLAGYVPYHCQGPLATVDHQVPAAFAAFLAMHQEI
jgi:hypothetical protein